MSARIPASWVESAFSELNQFESSAIDPAQFPEESFELYSVPSFPTGKPEFLKGAAIGSTKQTVEPNDVLVCKINPRINRVWQVDAAKQYRQIASSEWIGFRSDVLHTKFYRHYFTSSDFRELICTDVTGVGGSLTRAQPKKVATFPVPLAPLPEQKRIADKLDAVLTRVDACRDRLDHIPTILKRFRQSVLAAATSGKLTEDWRSLQGLSNKVQSVLLKEDEIIVPKLWSIFTLREVIDPDRPLCYGVVQPGDERSGGVPLIRVQDMDRGGVLTSELRTVSPDIDAEYKRSRVIGGDLLVSVVGTIGRTAIVPHGLEANIARAIARVACRTGVNSKWVNYWLSSEALQWWLTSSSKEVARKTLNLSDIALANVAIPSVEEQTEIVRRVEALFDCADRLEARYTVARAQVEKLIPATLAKAFRGELVPQDPNDEPASVLLERIQAARAAVIGTGSPKRRKVSEKAVCKFNAEVIMLELSRIKSDHLKSILKEQGKLAPKVLWQASQLSIEDFYEQLRTEEAKRLLREVREGSDIFLEAA